MPMQTSDHVIFRIDRHTLALPALVARRALRAAWAVPLAGSPDYILGVLDVGGEPLAVVNMRRLLGLPEREMRPSDRLLVARTGEGQSVREVALLVDEIDEVRELSAEELKPARLAMVQGRTTAGLAPAGGDMHAPSMILVQDMERLFTDEAEDLRVARLLDEWRGGTGNTDAQLVEEGSS